jgi:ATP-dependent RNA helicase DbpA
MPFDLLPPDLRVGLDRAGFTEPTPIQAAVLPVALSGRDVVGLARTGSGKTAAFAWPLLAAIDVSQRRPQALVMSPTRELAQQLTGVMRQLGAGLPGLRVVLLTGGTPSGEQRQSLAEGVHVVVGTPGRLLAHLERERLDLAALKVLVLDEADRMLDMGFEDEVLEVVGQAPDDRQTLLFSATWPDEMATLSHAIQDRPVRLGEAEQLDAQVLRQSVVFVKDRNRALAAVLAARAPCPTLVFCETRVQCRKVLEFLVSRGASALTLHGELEQRERDDVLTQLRNGSVRVLVATNVAARGLDIDGLALVITYELSPDPSVHTHRVGRTARASETGEAVVLVRGDRERARLAAVEEQVGRLKRTAVPKGGPLTHWTAANRTLFIMGGRRDKLRPGDILGALTQGAGIPGDAVGEIQITDRRAWVAVAADQAESARSGLARTRIKKKRYRVRLLD